MMKKMKTNGFNMFLSYSFWDSVFVKVTESLISVKVWGLVAITTLSSVFLVKGYINGDNWVMINSSVYGIIYGMREIFKMSRIKIFEESIKDKKENKEGDDDWVEVGNEVRKVGLTR